MERLTKCMQHSPSWEADGFSASQEILFILLNSQVHCRIHNSPPLVPTLNQSSSLHALPFYIFKVSFNIIILSTPSSSTWSLSFMFYHQNTMHFAFPLYVQHVQPIVNFMILLPE